MTREEAIEHMRAFRAVKLERVAELRKAADDWSQLATVTASAIRADTCHQFAVHARKTAERYARDAEAMGVLLDG